MSRAHRINLGGLDFIPDLSGALFAADIGALLVADLHLEKGSSLARRGVHLPPYDTRQSLAMLRAVVDATRPRQLIFLGDSFHDGAALERIDAADLATLKGLVAERPTVWISGNHDPSPPAGLGGAVAAEVIVGPVTLRHEPRSLREGEMEIAGHLHPAAAIDQRGRRIRCRCFVADRRRVIMPAFGSYTGGLAVSSPAFDGLLSDYHVWMLGGRAVHRFPASRIR